LLKGVGEIWEKRHTMERFGAVCTPRFECDEPAGSGDGFATYASAGVTNPSR
jgi:hypothetical protein